MADLPPHLDLFLDTYLPEPLTLDPNLYEIYYQNEKTSGAMTEAAKAATSAADPGDASSGTGRSTRNSPQQAPGEKQQEVAADADTGGDSSSESTSPSATNPIKGTGVQRRAVRKLLRQLYEKEWGEREMVWNSTRRALCHQGDAAPTDKVRLLDAEKRERLADSLFNQAYSAVMAVGTFSSRDHVESTVDTLIGDPLKASELWRACKIRWHDRLGIGVHTIRALLGGKPTEEDSHTAAKGEKPTEEDPQAAARGTASTAAPPHSPLGGTRAEAVRPEPDFEHIVVKEEVDWDSREDEVIETPPLLEEGEDAGEDGTWKDFGDEVGKQAPKTPELLLSEDEGGIEAGMKQQWPSQEALATIFRDTTWEELRKEWGMDTPASEQPETPKGETDEQLAGERSSVTPPLEQDEIVRQVMQDLREHGGGARQADAEMEDIQVEPEGGATTTALSARVAGTQLRADQERKRTLQVGDMVVKLPTRRGGPARGSLQAKVQRLARTLSASHAGEASTQRGGTAAESLRSQMTRLAKTLDEGEGLETSRKDRREKRRGPAADRPPLRRRRHLDAI
ncbi:unnamed protein product [Symbiodinium sp. KB8]|nr:unnamed protein product [Symbiodinium sp. KB8]